MNKRKLLKKKWHTFERYPKQGDDIVLHCIANNGKHEFMTISDFNAVTFNPKRVLEVLPNGDGWTFEWLSADEI